MTSANRSSEPIAYDEQDAFERLAGVADAFRGWRASDCAAGGRLGGSCWSFWAGDFAPVAWLCSRRGC